MVKKEGMYKNTSPTVGVPNAGNPVGLIHIEVVAIDLDGR